MPRYRVLFREVNDREVTVDADSPTAIRKEWMERSDLMLDWVEDSVEIDGHYEDNVEIIKIEGAE